MVKNKVVHSLSSTYLNIFFDHSLDYVSEIIGLALEKNAIIKKGSWFYFREIKIDQGKEGLNFFLKDKKNLEIFNKIEILITKEKEQNQIK